MPDEARKTRNFGESFYQADATVTPYEVRQGPTGLAEVFDSATSKLSTEYPTYYTRGQFKIAKTSGVVILKGGRVYWDHSTNTATYKKVNDRDFYLGRAAEDAASAGPTVEVLLNEDPPYDIDVSRDPFDTTIIGTQGLNTMGLFRRGGAHKFILSATNEAQKVDILSKDGFAKTANAIVEFAFEVVDDGAGTVVDVSVGIADDTNATDADSIANSVFMHLDANNVNINLESDDGTTEVAATDTTIDYTMGSRHEVWIDMRNPADVQIYVDAVLALDATTFNVNTSSPIWKLLAHIEKTASTDAYDFDLEWLRARFAEQ